MKFIKIRGRIIPIKEKGETSKKFETRLTNQDALTGLGAGFVSGHFLKRTKLRFAVQSLSLIGGLRTTAARINEHGLKKGVWEDIKASFIKTGSGLIGGGIGGATAGLATYARPSAKVLGKKLGDSTRNFSDMLKKMPKKNVDLSSGSKVFKAKYKKTNPLAGLLK